MRSSLSKWKTAASVAIWKLFSLAKVAKAVVSNWEFPKTTKIRLSSNAFLRISLKHFKQEKIWREKYRLYARSKVIES